MNVAICWDKAPCSPYVNRRFGGRYNLHLQGRKSAEQETSVARQNDFVYPTECHHKENKVRLWSRSFHGRAAIPTANSSGPYMLSRSSASNTPTHNSYIFNKSRFRTEEHLSVFLSDYLIT
jgi:hypothetical protein